MQGHELSAAPGVAGEQQSLRRSNVVLRVEVESGLGAKQIGKLLDRGESGKAAARGLRTAYTLRRSAPANPKVAPGSTLLCEVLPAPANGLLTLLYRWRHPLPVRRPRTRKRGNRSSL